MTVETRGRLTHRATALGIRLTDPLVDRLVVYYDLLFRWNQTINLTALEDSDQAVDKLILEPVVAASHVPRNGLIMDVGSGGGSPAVPLALAAAASRLLMVESRTRKTAFLHEVVRELGLPADVETARVEDLANRVDLVGTMDVVSMRAVRPDLRFLGLLDVFLRDTGRLALFTGETGLPLPMQLKQLALERLIPQLHSSLLIAVRRPHVPRGT